MITFSLLSLTLYQWMMVACALITAAVIFALLRHVPKTPKTQRLQAVAVVIAFVVIIATVFEKLGWIH
jgi:bacteriorhodopsin